MAQATVVKGERLAYLDNLKWMLIAGIIAAHAIQGYSKFGSWTYQDIQEVTLSPAVEMVFVVAAVSLGALFMMALFFLMSGLVTEGSLRRKGPRRFAIDRLWRLGIPFAVYTLVVWPLVEFAVLGPFLHRTFWVTFSNTDPLLDNGPMWFVGVLLLFSLSLAAVRWARPTEPRPERVLRGLDLGLLAAAVGLSTFLIRVVFPADSNQPLNIHLWAWPEYLAMFGLGVVASKNGWLKPVSGDMVRGCGIVAVVGAVCAVALVLTAEPLGLTEDAYFGGWHVTALLSALTEGAIAVTAPIWILGFAQRHLNGNGPMRRAMARSSYLAFMMQGPVLVALALMVRPLDVPAEAKALLVATLGVAGSFGLAYPIVMRTRLGRFL